MVGCSRPPVRVSNTWNPKTAATYLDYRETWWKGWITASRDHDTYCVSCHTVVPYIVARPRLRSALGEVGPSSNELAIIDDVRARVRLWKSEEPYYQGGRYGEKTAESRGTEAVLNAFILATYDAQTGRLSEDTRAALANMWALQKNAGERRGAWDWLQFDEEPWEAKESPYYGACLAAIAVGSAPGNYASTPTIQSNLKLLRDYLTREASSQSIINQIFLLWASTKVHNLLDSAKQSAVIRQVLARQQPDGGWRLASITWSWNHWTVRSLLQMWLREDGTPMQGKSDGLATGLVTFVLEQAGVSPQNAQLQRGLSWLTNNQTEQGFWPSYSVNKRRNPQSETAKFMSDAATAFAVLAITDRPTDRPTEKTSPRTASMH